MGGCLSRRESRRVLHAATPSLLGIFCLQGSYISSTNETINKNGPIVSSVSSFFKKKIGRVLNGGSNDVVYEKVES